MVVSSRRPLSVYKGFFDFEKAKKTADQMRKDGFDVTLGASSAFSTLGWFNDPLVSTTLTRRFGDTGEYGHA